MQGRLPRKDVEAAGLSYLNDLNLQVTTISNILLIVCGVNVKCSHGRSSSSGSGSFSDDQGLNVASPPKCEHPTFVEVKET